MRLAVAVDHTELRFTYALSDGTWTDVGPPLDASLLTAEAGYGEQGSFAGAFVGMAAFDVSGAGMNADFRRFTYEGAD